MTLKRLETKEEKEQAMRDFRDGKCLFAVKINRTEGTYAIAFDMRTLFQRDGIIHVELDEENIRHLISALQQTIDRMKN